MKKPYYVTYQLNGGGNQYKPLDVEVGKHHGADIIIKRLQEELEAKLHNGGMNLEDVSVKIVAVFKL